MMKASIGQSTGASIPLSLCSAATMVVIVDVSSHVMIGVVSVRGLRINPVDVIDLIPFLHSM